MGKRDEDRYGRGGHWRHRGHEHDREHAHDRGYIERAADEVRSWFGDDDAERRRHTDEYRDRAEGRHRGDWDRPDASSWRGESRDSRELRSSYPRSGEWAWSDRGRDWNARGDEGISRDWDAAQRSRGSYTGDRTWADSDRERDWNRTNLDQPTSWGRSRSWDRTGSWDRDRSSDRTAEWDRSRDSAWRSGSTGSADEGRRDTGAGFWGRGPKGYQRSDSRIQEDVCDRLTYADVDAENIEVSVTNGEVTLSGYVRDRWDKRRAEDIVEAVAGVREVHNHVRVQREDRGVGTHTSSASEQPGTVLGVNPTAGSHITSGGGKQDR